MTNAQKLTLELIRYELNNIEVDNDLICALDDELLKEIFDIATAHDVGYMVASALHKLNLLSGEAQAGFFREQLASVYRYERIKYDTDCIVQLFENERIDFILLKGAVIRELYPKPEMRMSCDLDILVPADVIERAGELLKTKLSFSYVSRCGHEINWISPSGLKVELHFTLLERDYKLREILDNAWDYAKPIIAEAHRHIFTNEFFVFYHISHISKHLLHGGCGIRQFLDLWFISEKLTYDKDALNVLLEKANLVKFADVAFDISKAWFSDESSINLPDGIETYILDGGSYGNLENSIAVEGNDSGDSKIKIFIKRVFASPKTIRYLYPMAEKHPVLIPYYSVARWCRIIFKDRMKKQSKMIKAIANTSKEKQEYVNDIMKKIGLSEQK